MFEGGKKLVWPKVFARTEGMPVQSVYNRITRKKLNVEVKIVYLFNVICRLKNFPVLSLIEYGVT